MMHQVFFVLLTPLVFGCQSPDVPSPCKSGPGPDHLDCSGLGLTSVPTLCHPHTQTLDLSHNNLTVILPGTLAGYANLTELDISHNNIVYVHPLAFAGLTRLRVLALGKNLLNFTLLEPAVFSHTPDLRHLDISGNYLGFQLPFYPGHLFTSLSNLQHLEIDGIPNPTVDFGPAFRALVSLESLRIRSVLTHISNTTLKVFENCPLTYLAVWSGWLETLEPDAFAHFPRLETLDLSFNPRLGFINASVAWPGLKYTNIKNLILERASPFESSIITLEPDFFYALNETNITKLVLAGNNIVTTFGLFSVSLPHLVELNCSRNRLTQVQTLIQDIGKLKNLVVLDMSQQSKRLAISGEELLAHYTPSINISIPIPQLPAADLDLLSLEEGAFSEITVDVSEPRPLPNSADWDVILPDTLEVVLLSGSLTLELDQLPKTILRNGLSLRVLEYAENGLTHFDGALILANRSNNPLSINFADNNCRSIENLVADPNTSLAIEEVILNKNKLNDFFNGPRGAHFLKTLANLKAIDLSENTLKELPKTIFDNSKHLEKINLANNALRKLEIVSKSLDNLQHLDVSHNLISSLGQSTTDRLDAIARRNRDEAVGVHDRGNLTLNLAGNPLSCSCSNLDFLRWVKAEHDNGEKLIVFLEFDQYYCFLDSEERMWHRGGLDDVLNILDLKCKRDLIIILCTTLGAFAVLVICASVFICRHKWDIRFCCLTMVIKRKRQQIQNRRYTYDAMVSFHESARSWIQHQMMIHLEQRTQNPLRLCVHFRDFPPGAPIEENITTSIKASRKTLLVIDKESTKSSWCHFEMQMARAMSFDEGRDVIITIIRDSTVLKSTKGISQTLLNILRKNTYIVWPENPTEQEEFWEKVYRAVTSEHQRPTRCECGRALTWDGHLYDVGDGHRRTLPQDNHGRRSLPQDNHDSLSVEDETHFCTRDADSMGQENHQGFENPALEEEAVDNVPRQNQQRSV